MESDRRREEFGRLSGKLGAESLERVVSQVCRARMRLIQGLCDEMTCSRFVQMKMTCSRLTDSELDERTCSRFVRVELSRQVCGDEDDERTCSRLMELG